MKCLSKQQVQRKVRCKRLCFLVEQQRVFGFRYCSLADDSDDDDPVVN